MKRVEGIITLKQLEKAYDRLQQESLEKFNIVISQRIKQSLDEVWKNLKWYEKLWINIKRVIRSRGLYPYDKTN